MEALLVLLVIVAAAVGGATYFASRSSERAAARAEAELAPVRTLVEEDVTALGVELQGLDADVAAHSLDAGATADYQRALDAYEAAKVAAGRLSSPDEVRHVTEILEDGRYAMACVRARVDGEPLPTRRPPCFFDPRHGLSVAEVTWAPPGGASRDVPACALDAERVRAGAEPDVRQVMVGPQRVPYWQGGRAYEPYAAGYYGAFAPMQWMFMGALFSGGFGGFDGFGDGGGEGIGDAADDGGMGGMFDGFDGFGGFGE
ncbi:hypothetical protein [Nocardioides jishulii]|uniref:Uncharacterized protein n=1 Tax=Nocardioides jishulii TaxID=2575440 RepID=A0A4U2YHY8_9ACTN|nr:hypothetical protein [Nocardioides jishulii]QCX28033.1 hypothetical protein FCL41_11275 [Nocardioides jishulii]TKI60697.1 hypothetical protein FC770_14350 [Nocardioides jishulii]